MRKRTLWGLIIVLVLAALVGRKFVYQELDHRYLVGLQASEVTEIAIGETRITGTGPIQSLVDVLRESRGFSPNHTQTGKALPLIIRAHDGSSREFRVARIIGTKAVLISSRNHLFLDRNDRLAAALEQLGINMLK